MIELQTNCKKCGRVPGDHTPYEMHCCYGVQYLLRFLDIYDNRKEKSMLKTHAVLQEMGRQFNKFAKTDWEFFKNFKMDDKL